MWQHNYTPVAGSLGISALVAGLPIFVLLWLLGVKRKPAWIAGVAGLGAAAFVALAAYGMPAAMTVSAVAYGAAFGLFPIGWIVFGSIGIPIVTLSGITGLPQPELSGAAGRILAPVSLIVPGYMVGVMSGRAGLAGALPAAAVCGAAFAVTQYYVSTYVGPQISAISSSMVSIIALVLLLKLW